MPTTQNIVIDLNTRGATPVAFTHQGDTARTFVFEVYNNGEEFDVSSYSVRVAALLPADNGYYVIAGDNMATGDTYGNTITVTLPAEYTQKFGNGVLTLVLTGSGATIRPINIDLRIQKSADAPETIAGASDFIPVLQRYMAEDMQTYINAWLDAHPEAMQYYISGSKLVLDSNGILSIENDTDDIIEALDLDTLRAEVTDLKSDLNAKDGLINKGTYSSTEFVQGKRTIANYDTITADSKRCTTKMRFHLYKDDQLTVSGIGNNQKAAIVSSYGYDSGWKTSDYTYTATSEGYLFINVATSDGNTNITPSDISITVTVNDRSSITYKNTAIVDELNIGQIRNTVRKNLIGKNVGTKYPAKIKKGEKITVSSVDGQVFSTSFRIRYFNANKESIDYNTVPANVNTYTITLAYDNVCFISVNKSPQTTIQVEIGDTKTAYEPYFDDIHECDSVLWAKELSRKGYFVIDKNEMVNGTRDSNGYGDYADRCHSRDIFIPAHKGDRIIASTSDNDGRILVAVTESPLGTGSIYTSGWQQAIDIVNENEGYYVFLGNTTAESFNGTFKVIPNIYTYSQNDEVFSQEITDTINSIREYQTEPSITFILCTDIHYGKSENGDPYLFDKSVENMRAVINSVRTDFAVCLGDVTDGDSSNTESYAAKVNNAIRNLGVPYLLAIGNHDDNRYKTGSTFTVGDMYRYYDSFVYNSVVFNDNTNGRDYYVDCDNYKMRFVVLDSNTIGAYGFASETVTWFQNNALNTPNDYLVVVLVHESSVSEQNYNNSSLDNGAAITNAITGYLEQGKPIIQFYGHSHCDVAFTSPFLSIGTNCLKFENTNGDPSKWPSGATKPTRVVGEISEDCWDMVVLRPLSRKVDCIRFGAGNNRSFTY